MRGVALLFVVLLIVPYVIAEDQVLINSHNWQDVYSGILYAKLMNKDVHYIAEESQGVQLLQEVLSPGLKNVLLIQGDAPFIPGYKSLLEGKGFTVELLSTNANLALLQRLPEDVKNKLILTEDVRGHDSISTAPYALLTRSYVLLTGKESVDAILPTLQNAEVLAFGRLDSETQLAVAPFIDEALDGGDRYRNNIAIVKRFLKEKPTQQVQVSDGEFIELGLFSNEFPVVFIGRSTPPHVIEFLRESEIKAGVVIGYGLYDAARAIRDATGMKVLLKYGQGRNSQLYALDIFPLPSIDTSMNIKSVRYNTLTQELEVFFVNTNKEPGYFQTLSHQIKAD